MPVNYAYDYDLCSTRAILNCFLLHVQSVNINEFLKPADGENYYRPGGRGRGRGRGRGGYTGNSMNNAQAPSIEDAGHFPSLGGK